MWIQLRLGLLKHTEYCILRLLEKSWTQTPKKFTNINDDKICHYISAFHRYHEWQTTPNHYLFAFRPFPKKHVDDCPKFTAKSPVSTVILYLFPPKTVCLFAFALYPSTTKPNPSRPWALQLALSVYIIIVHRNSFRGWHGYLWWSRARSNG